MLEPPLLSTDDPLDESFVLPALVRFNGVPEVGPAGDILYRFPDLETTAKNNNVGASSSTKRGASRSSSPPRGKTQQPVVLAEAEQSFSLAPPSNQLLAGLLGGANFLGVGFLTRLLSDPAILRTAAPELIRGLSSLLPGLQVYAVLFFAIPAVRALFQATANARIRERNARREDAERLLSSPPPRVVAKLKAAEAAAQGRVFDDAAAVFSSDEPIDEGADFERRLAEREKARRNGLNGKGW